MTYTEQAHPLDAVLRARLGMPPHSRRRLGIARMVLGTVDAISRLAFGKPFFALRESEALMVRLSGVTGAALVRSILARNGGTTIVPHGLQHIPAQGPVIIASTHPTGMFDFVAHAGALLARRPDLKVVANTEAAAFMGDEMIVPVEFNRNNRATSARRTHSAMKAHLDSGGALLIFGSGRVPDTSAGRLVEPQWRGGATRVSQICGVPLVPAALDARNSPYYYRIRRLARAVSGGNDNFGALIGSLRYTAELLEKLGGRYDVFYGPAQPPGTAAHLLQARAEGLVRGLFRAP